MYGINYIFQMITLTEKVINFFEVFQLVSSKALFQTQEVLLLESLEFKPLYSSAFPPGQ